MKEGFRGPIYATPPTIDLCGILLPDSGHLQEEDAEFYNKTQDSKHDPALPLYTLEEAQQCLNTFVRCTSEKCSNSAGSFIPLRARRAHPRIGHGGDHLELKRQARAACCSPAISDECATSNIAPGKVVRSGPAEGERLRTCW